LILLLEFNLIPWLPFLPYAENGVCFTSLNFGNTTSSFKFFLEIK
jgi:hypothetical protein